MEKTGADRGIDGMIRFVDEANGRLKQLLVQVKSGHVISATMRATFQRAERLRAASTHGQKGMSGQA